MLLLVIVISTFYAAKISSIENCIIANCCLRTIRIYNHRQATTIFKVEQSSSSEEIRPIKASTIFQYVPTGLINIIIKARLRIVQKTL